MDDLQTKAKVKHLAALFVLLAGLATTAQVQAQSTCAPTWTKINTNGFGGNANIYIHSLVPFGGYLYAGTLNRVSGAEIWRYNGVDWTRVVTGGFGNLNNESVRNMIAYAGQLYAGTYNIVDGAQIWRSNDGVAWEALSTPGISVPTNIAVRALETFNGYLYVGLQAEGAAAQIWRTPDGESWTQVIADGFGDPLNSSVHMLKVFSGRLYAGTRVDEDSGAQVWVTEDGQNFNIVVGPGAPTPGGFGQPGNGTVFSMEVFEGHLYLGTADWSLGFTVWRTADGSSFEQIGVRGFGDSTNAYAWRFEAYEDALWLGVMNRSVGTKSARLLRSFNGTDWEEMVGPTSSYMAEGFGNERNWGVRSQAKFRGSLIVGTAQCWLPICANYVNGAEIWEWSGEECPPASP